MFFCCALAGRGLWQGSGAILMSSDCFDLILFQVDNAMAQLHAVVMAASVEGHGLLHQHRAVAGGYK